MYWDADPETFQKVSPPKAPPAPHDGSALTHHDVLLWVPGLGHCAETLEYVCKHYGVNEWELRRMNPGLGSFSSRSALRPGCSLFPLPV